MTLPFHVVGHATELTTRFQKIKEGLKGASVRVRTGKYKGRTGQIIGAITSPEALIEATIKLDVSDGPHQAKPRLRLGITEFEVI